MFLLDTNVLPSSARLVMGRPTATLSPGSPAMDAAVLYISAITLMEIELGILRMERRDAAQGAQLRTWMTHHVLPRVSGSDSAHRCRRRVPLCFPPCARIHGLSATPFIAATALVHSMTVRHPKRRRLRSSSRHPTLESLGSSLTAHSKILVSALNCYHDRNFSQRHRTSPTSSFTSSPRSWTAGATLTRHLRKPETSKTCQRHPLPHESDGPSAR